MTVLLQIMVKIVGADWFDVGEDKRCCGKFWRGPQKEGKILLKDLGVAIAEFMHRVK